MWEVRSILKLHIDALNLSGRRTSAAIIEHSDRLRSDSASEFRLHSVNFDGTIRIHRHDGMDGIIPRNKRNLAALMLKAVLLKVFFCVFSVRTVSANPVKVSRVEIEIYHVVQGANAVAMMMSVDSHAHLARRLAVGGIEDIQNFAIVVASIAGGTFEALVREHDTR